MFGLGRFVKKKLFKNENSQINTPRAAEKRCKYFWRGIFEPTLYLHPGAGKTGTSTIQKYFGQNRDWIEASGILYPVFGDEDKITQFPWHGNDLRLWDELKTGRLDVLTALIEELAEESREKRKPVFLSNEVWAQAAAWPTFEKFCKLLAKHFNIVLIGFVRDPLSWSYSAWNQIVRTVPFTHTFAEFLVSDLRGRVQWPNIALWRRYSKRMHFFSFDEHKSRLIETVFSVLGLSTANRPPQAREAVNESLHDSGIAFMLAFNAVPELAEDQGLRIKILSRLQMSGCSKKSRPDPALALLAEWNNAEMFRELEPYLKKEQMVTDHSLAEPAGDYERISREDAAAAMEVIVAHLDK